MSSNINKGKKAKIHSPSKSSGSKSVKRKHEGGDKGKSGKMGKAAPSSAKDVKLDRKKHKSNGELLENLKGLWNSVRERAVDSQVRVDVVARMAKMLTGTAGSLALKHDASRVIQFVLQNGNDDAQKMLVDELIPNCMNLSISPYGHFTMLKLLNQCGAQRETQDKLVRAMKGNFTRIATNIHGARVVEAMFKTFSEDVVHVLKVEFYAYKSQQQQLLTSTPDSFQDYLQSCSDIRRKTALEGMHTLLLKFCKNDSLFDFSFVQEILLEFAMYAASNGSDDPVMRDLIDAVAPSIRRVITTRAGAKLGCLVATHGAAKDRKKMLKALKGHVKDCLHHPTGYLLILKLIDTVDDTVSVQKMLLEEVVKGDTELEGSKKKRYTATGELINDDENTRAELPVLISLACHSSASKMLLTILLEKSLGDFGSSAKSYFDEDEMFILGLVSTTSKKEDNARRQEHQQYLKVTLLDALANNLNDLLASDSGIRVVMSACRTYKSDADALLKIIFASILQNANDAAKEWAGMKDKKAESPLLPPPFMFLVREFLQFVAQEAATSTKDFVANAVDQLTSFKADYSMWVDCNASCHIMISIASVSELCKALVKVLKGKKNVVTAIKKRAKTSKVVSALVSEIGI